MITYKDYSFLPTTTLKHPYGLYTRAICKMHMLTSTHWIIFVNLERCYLAHRIFIQSSTKLQYEERSKSPIFVIAGFLVQTFAHDCIYLLLMEIQITWKHSVVQVCQVLTDIVLANFMKDFPPTEGALEHKTSQSPLATLVFVAIDLLCYAFCYYDFDLGWHQSCQCWKYMYYVIIKMGIYAVVDAGLSEVRLDTPGYIHQNSVSGSKRAK